MQHAKVLTGTTTRDRSVNKLIFGWTAFAAMPGILDLPQEVAGACLIALVVFPVAAAWILRRKLIVTDPIIVVGAMWVLAAGLPAIAPWLYKDPIWPRLSYQSVDMATLWMYRGWAACSLGYWGIKVLSTNHARSASPAKIAVGNNLRVAVGLVGLTASVVYVILTGAQAYSHIEGFAATSTLDQTIHALRQLSKIYIFLYFVARGRRRLLAREHWLLYAILAMYLVIFAASASKGVAIELIAMWVLGNAASDQKGKLAKELALGVVVLTVVYWVFLIVTAYRFELRAMVEAPATTFGEAMSVQFDAAQRALEKVITGESIGSFDNEYDAHSMLDRLALVVSFATVLDVTGQTSPYENATASFLAPIYAVLPRDFLDDKVHFFDSGDLATMLGWRFGGFSVSLPASLFWAWGFEGILPAMFFIGVVLAVLDRRGEQEGTRGLFARVLLMSIVLSLLDVGVHFQPIVIGVVRVMIFLFLLHTAVSVLSSGSLGRRKVRRSYAR